MGKKSRRQRSTAAPPQQRRTAIMERHDPRAKANRLRLDFESLLHDDPWSEQRLNVFDLYIDAIVPLNMCKESESRLLDVKLLKRIRRCKAEPAFYRAAAYNTIGLCRLTFGDPYADTLKWFDRAFHLYNAADDDERNRIACLQGFEVRMGDLYDQRRGEAFDWIRKLDQTFCIGRWIPDFRGDEVQYTNGTVSIVAGWDCDVCGKHRDEVEGGVLFQCSNCSMAHYCSRECQQKAWKEEGHKQECRGKRDFREGDCVALTKTIGSFKKHDRVLLISPSVDNENMEVANNVAYAVATTQQWSVKKEDDTTIELVPEKYIRRIRSAMWHGWGKEDIDMLAKHIIESKKKESKEGGECRDYDNVLPELISSNIAEEENFDGDCCDEYSLGDDDTAA